MARATNGAPEFLRRAEAADAGAQGYSMDERRQPPTIIEERSMGLDDYAGRRDHVNLAKLEQAISTTNAAKEWLAGEPTRLQRIAADMLDLRWEEFVALAEGFAADAKVMHEWAKTNKLM